MRAIESVRRAAVVLAGGVAAALLAAALPVAGGGGSAELPGATVALAAPSCNATADVTRGSAAASVPVYRGSRNCLLGVGNQGPAVSDLQFALNSCDAGHLTVDGIYGPRTRAAVLQAQKLHGARRDGVYGPETASKMLWPFYDDVGKRHCLTLP